MILGDVILLESQKKDHPASVRSFLAALPKKKLYGFGTYNYCKDGCLHTHFEKPPWQAIKEFQKSEKDWMFGYLGYDLKNYTEKLTSNNAAFSNLPNYYFMIPGLLIEIESNGTYKVLKGKVPEYDASKICESEHRSVKITNEKSISQHEYQSKVRMALELIHKGEIYEVNYSYLKQFNFEGSGWNLYQSMKDVGPVPFGAFLKIDDIEVSCASPERFLKRERDKVFSQPIKGTISNSTEHDITHLKSEKNLAENLMIVDLVRNDLNRVAVPNSVHVSNLFEIQSFNTVHQLVSTIEAKVEANTHSVDILKACFPMGSMTGAPKIAAMEAIEKLEDYQRGLYSGAIGYFKPDGDFDFNVVIRTSIIENGKLMYPVGGAITSDSSPEDEWKETLIKTEALKKACK
jgi:para-aminobenzoate synthetase component 1